MPNNCLKIQVNLLDVTYEAGLTSPSRLHDLFVTCEAVTPGEFKTKGEGLTISYGFHPSPFGECMLATTERGICGFYFVKNGDRNDIFSELENSWKNAQLIENPDASRAVVNQIFNRSFSAKSVPLHLILNGTNFQIKSLGSINQNSLWCGCFL